MSVISCGTLVIDGQGRILLCHATGTHNWDIPKGIQDPGETTLETARREMMEETGLVFDEALFQDLGGFAYRSDKRLHLYKVEVGDSLCSLDHLHCTSHFPHRYTGQPTPEADDFAWCTREQVRTMCWPRMAQLLLSLDW
jgi:putative (di)nucleoside polyphosphate hydrolase